MTPTLIEIAIEPQVAADRPALLVALETVAAEVAGLDVAADARSGKITLGGQSEAQLEAALARLREVHGIALRCSAPQVGYRETIAERTETDHTHKKRIGTRGEFARVKLVLEPRPGAGSSFGSAIDGGAVPDGYLVGVGAGVAAACRAGVVAGCPVIDVAATLVDGAYHDADSSIEAFETAALEACRIGFERGGPILLEPVMRVEITLREGLAGVVRDDLVRRRGRIFRVSAGAPAIIVARAPLAELLGYAQALRRLAGDDAYHAMIFDGYAPVDPQDPPAFPGVAALRIA